MSKVQVAQRFKWLLLFAAGLGLPTLGGLGVWQLERAGEKAALLDSWQRGGERVRRLDERSLQPFDRIVHSGTFDQQRWFFLDNRTRAGRVGYELVGFFKPEGMTRLVAVNLGWLPASPDRSILPAVRMPAGKLAINGRLVRPGTAFVLVPDEGDLRWPARLQRFDHGLLQEMLQQPLAQWMVHAEQPLLPGVATGWQPVVMPAEKHLGYAAQWFLLALALAVLLLYSWHRVKREENE